MTRRVTIALVVAVIVTAGAAYAPYEWLRIPALVLFLLALPVPASYSLARRLVGRPALFDVRIGASAAILLLLLLAVGASFVGLQVGIGRATAIVTLAVVSLVLLVALRALPVPDADDIDRSVRAPSVRLSPGPVLAFLVTAACVVAAVAVSVVTERDHSDRGLSSALSVEPLRNTAATRTYRVRVKNNGADRERYSLTISSGSRVVRTTQRAVAAGAEWTQRVSLPMDASIACRLTSLAPRGTVREVRIAH